MKIVGPGGGKEAGRLSASGPNCQKSRKREFDGANGCGEFLIRVFEDMCLENAGGKWASTLRRLLPYADGEGVHAVCPRGKPFPDHCRGKRLLPEQGRVGFEQDLGAPFPVCIADAQILLSDTSQVQYSRIGVRILDGRYRVLSSGHGTTRPLPGGRSPTNSTTAA